MAASWVESLMQRHKLQTSCAHQWRLTWIAMCWQSVCIHKVDGKYQQTFASHSQSDCSRYKWLFDWLPPARWPVGTAASSCQMQKHSVKRLSRLCEGDAAVSGAVRLSICASPVIWYLKFMSWTQRLTDYMLVVKGQDHLTNQAFGHDFRGHTLIITKFHTKV